MQLWDGIWSVPIAFSLFIFVAIIGQQLFGVGVGFYDPSFWQAALLAAGELIFFNIIVFLGLYFNFRHVWRYYKGEHSNYAKDKAQYRRTGYLTVHDAQEEIFNKSKDDFNFLKPWQRILVLLFLYCFYIAVLVILYKVHV